ncbi:MAG TPA: ribbon-helix-helix protein, CopG family [Tepidisphaeraceae bacterium]|nr:ribbon-helix-helix protein, CopG family [Tepidisphaeraceae bacterium]
MATDRRKRTRPVGFRIQADVDAYLKELSEKTDRPRSWLLHAIVREYRRAVEQKLVSEVELHQPLPPIPR